MPTSTVIATKVVTVGNRHYVHLKIKENENSNWIFGTVCLDKMKNDAKPISEDLNKLATQGLHKVLSNKDIYEQAIKISVNICSTK